MTKNTEIPDNDDSICPACGSEDIVGDSIDFVENRSIYQPCSCSACGVTWVNAYRFRGSLWVQEGDGLNADKSDTPTPTGGRKRGRGL